MKREKIIISRTDSIGDVVLTLPLAGVLKKRFPGIEIIFLGRNYTRDVVSVSENVDHFLSWDDIRKDPVPALRKVGADTILHVFPVREIAVAAWKARIPERTGTLSRIYHWTTCNRLVRLSRKRSYFHEAQLNIRLAAGITGIGNVPLDSVHRFYGMKAADDLPHEFRKLIRKDKFNLILHPRSKGSAREWGLDHFGELIDLLPEDAFEIFITGTQEEGLQLRQEDFFRRNKSVNDLTGRMDLSTLIRFIGSADGLVSASTGPLHLAAALGIHAIGIYPPIRPMHPGRWAPLGEKASFLVIPKVCHDCRNSHYCDCIRQIRPEMVRDKIIDSIKREKFRARAEELKGS